MITYKDINQAYKDFLKAEEKYRALTRRTINFQIKLDRFEEKYTSLFLRKAGESIILVLTIVGHLALALTTATIAMPMFKEIFEELAGENGAYIPAAGMFGLSLGISYFMHCVSYSPSVVRTDRPSFSLTHLLAAIAGSAIYLVMIIAILLAAKEQLGEQFSEKTASLVLIFGIGELFLAYCAFLGWEILLVRSKRIVLKSYLQWLEKRKSASRVKAKEYRTYHEQFLHLMETQEETSTDAFKGQKNE